MKDENPKGGSIKASQYLMEMIRGEMTVIREQLSRLDTAVKECDTPHEIYYKMGQIRAKIEARTYLVGDEMDIDYRESNE